MPPESTCIETSPRSSPIRIERRPSRTSKAEIASRLSGDSSGSRRFRRFRRAAGARADTHVLASTDPAYGAVQRSDDAGMIVTAPTSGSRA